VLEHREVMPVGSNASTKIDVRILAATHADLLKRVDERQFRHDLFFRLNVFEIHLPALVNRTEDVALLANHFLLTLGSSCIVSEEALAFLKARPWPGNIRELRNAMEHAAIVARGGTIRPEHFPPPIGTAVAPGFAGRVEQLIREWVHESSKDNEPTDLYDKMLALVEPSLLDEVMKSTDNNRVAASRRLGLARATLRKLIAKYRGTADDEVEDE
jgi:two-component system, NtrC family, nitrogen regulation response regulator GlnG